MPGLRYKLTLVPSSSRDSANTRWSIPHGSDKAERSASLGDSYSLSIHLFSLLPSLSPTPRNIPILCTRAQKPSRHCDVQQLFCDRDRNEQLVLSGLSWKSRVSAPPSHSRPAQAPLQRFQKWSLSQLVILWNTHCPKPGSLLSSCQWLCAPPFSACCSSGFLNIKVKIFILLKSRIHEEGSFPWRSTEGK